MTSANLEVKELVSENVVFSIGLENKDWKTKSVATYTEFIKSDLSCFELLEGDDEKWFKPYFDIEIKPKDAKEFLDVEEGLINYAKSLICSQFDDANICVKSATSSDYFCVKTQKQSWIISFHLVVSNYKIQKSSLKFLVEYFNKLEMGKREVNDYIEITNPDFKLFDESIYNRDRKIRAVNACKEVAGVVEERPMRLIEGTIEQSIISACFDEGAFELNPTEEMRKYKQQQDAKKAKPVQELTSVSYAVSSS